MKTLRQKLCEKLTLRKIQWITLTIILTINVVIFIYISSHPRAADVETLTAITFFTAIVVSVIGFPTKKQQVPVILTIVGNMILVVSHIGLVGIPIDHLSPIMGIMYLFYFSVLILGEVLVLCGLSYSFYGVFPVFLCYLQSFGGLSSRKVRTISAKASVIITPIARRVSPFIPEPIRKIFRKIGDKTVGLFKFLSLRGEDILIYLFQGFQTTSYKSKRLIVAAFSSIELIFQGIYHSGVPIILVVILLTPIATVCYLQPLSLEHVKNGNFNRKIADWSILTSPNSNVGIRFQTGYASPEEPTLCLLVGSRKNLKYDYVKAYQSLNLPMAYGDWFISGNMRAVDVSDETNVLALSVVIALRDSQGVDRYLKYVLFEKGILKTTPTNGIVEVGRGRDIEVSFKGNVVEDIKRVWSVESVFEWKITAVELRVEFWGNWGDRLYVDAMFDDISLRNVVNLQWLFSVMSYVFLFTFILSTVSVGFVKVLKVTK